MKHAPDNSANRPAVTPLSDEELLRYARQLRLPEIGAEGQARLRSAKVLIVGVGGLGSPAATYLATAGVGCLGLADFDVVDHSNLHRQILHATADVGIPKLRSAESAIRQLNPNVQVILHEGRLTAAAVRDIIEPYDIVVDGSDNFPTRYILNDACALAGKPYVYGSIFRFEGQVSVFDARRGPCYRCLYPHPPEANLVPPGAESGIIGVVPGLIGLIQATETLKLILGKGRSLVGRLVLFDALDMKFREVAVAKNPDCALCGSRPTIREPSDKPRR